MLRWTFTLMRIGKLLTLVSAFILVLNGCESEQGGKNRSLVDQSSLAEGGNDSEQSSDDGGSQSSGASNSEGSSTSIIISGGSNETIQNLVPEDKKPSCSQTGELSIDCTAAKDHYYYDQAYNGRQTEGNDVVFTASNKGMTLNVPVGWYNGKNIRINSSDANSVVPMNIVNGISLLGVQGQLTAGDSYSQCSFSATQKTNGIYSTSTCSLDPNQNLYVYSSTTNGCDTSDGTVSGNCVLNAYNKYLTSIENQATCLDGSNSGGSKCRVEEGKFLYSSAYGGRQQSCGFNTNLTSSCWNELVGKYIIDSHLCSVNGTTATTSSCLVEGDVNAVKYVYTSTYGGRNRKCEFAADGTPLKKYSLTADSAPGCWLDASLKAKDSDLVKENIQLGLSVFGVSGSSSGTKESWYSAVQRSRGGDQTKISEEIAPNAGLKASSYPVPRVNRETAVFASASTDCRGELDCKSKNSGALWSGKTKGIAGEGNWTLIAKTGSKEVWRDEQTGLYWSSLVSMNEGSNWCRASGKSGSDPANICNDSGLQAQSIDLVESQCFELNSVLEGTEGQTGKVGINRNVASVVRVEWRLPSIHEFALANHDGLRYVLPDTGRRLGRDQNEWTTTLSSLNRSRADAWLFNSYFGYRKVANRSYAHGVRCVGRGIP